MPIQRIDREGLLRSRKEWFEVVVVTNEKGEFVEGIQFPIEEAFDEQAESAKRQLTEKYPQFRIIDLSVQSASPLENVLIDFGIPDPRDKR